MDVLGPGPDLFLGEPVEGHAHQLEVGVEVPAALLIGQRRQKVGMAKSGDEPLGRGHPVGGHTPLLGPPDGSHAQIGQGIGSEGTGDACFGFPVRAVADHRFGGAYAGGGMGDVVGHDLGGIRATRRHQRGDAGVEDRTGHRHGVGGGGQIRIGMGGVGHFPRLPKRQEHGAGPGPPAPEAWSATAQAETQAQAGGTWATTVTNGASTTGSSPGSTSVRSFR